MVISRTENLNFIIGKYQTAWNYSIFAAGHRSSAKFAYDVGDDHNAIYWLCEYGLDMLDCVQDLIWDWYPYEGTCPVPYFLKWHTIDTAPPVSWQSIVEAWIANDFEGRAPTIAVIDRMREIMWNEYFSVQWAQRPEDKYP